MQIDVSFTAQTLDQAQVAERVVVILDIFRATSTIVAALAQGAQGIIPVSNLDDAYEQLIKYPQALLGGERNSEIIPGFNLGNSPREYKKEVVQDKLIIMSTTNGTVAITKAQKAAAIFLGSFLNGAALTERLRNEDKDLLLACAGTKGTYSLEDTCCAGYLIKLLQLKKEYSLTDSARGALALYNQYQDNLPNYLKESRNGQVLLKKGRWDDICYCLEKNRYPFVPVFKQGVIIKDL